MVHPFVGMEYRWKKYHESNNMIESSGCLFYFAGYFWGPLKPPMWGEVGGAGPNESGRTPREEVRTSTCDDPMEHSRKRT